MKVVTFILSSVLILLFLNGLSCDDSLAMKECLQRYKDSSIISAKYLNYGCKLVCEQSQNIFQHSILQGINCPELKNTSDKNKICYNGLCIDPKSQKSYYSLGIQIVRGYFPKSQVEHYVEICVQRNNGSITRPLKDKNGCDCQTPIVRNSLEPKWGYSCPKTIVLSSNEKDFVEYARIVFEVYDEFSQSHLFNGNGFVLMKDLIRDQNSGKEIMVVIYQDINGQSKEVGRIFVVINWDFNPNSKLLR